MTARCRCAKDAVHLFCDRLQTYLAMKGKCDQHSVWRLLFCGARNGYAGHMRDLHTAPQTGRAAAQSAVARRAATVAPVMSHAGAWRAAGEDGTPPPAGAESPAAMPGLQPATGTARPPDASRIAGGHGGREFGAFRLPPPRTTADTPDAIRIRTPEQVTITLPPAGVGTRMLAALLDALVILGTVLAVLVVALLIGGVITYQPNSDAANGVLGALVLLALFFFVFGYYAALELLWDGQTVGKRTLHLRVLRDDGTPVDATAVLARTVVRLVDFLPVGYLVGLVTMIVDGRARRLGDIVGGTVVVRERDSAPTLREIALGAAPAALGPPLPGQAAPVQLLTPDEIAAAREFLRRAPTFPLPERAALAWRLATTLAAYLGYTAPLADPEWFIAWIVRSAAAQRM